VLKYLTGKYEKNKDVLQLAKSLLISGAFGAIKVSKSFLMEKELIKNSKLEFIPSK